uniref:2Fe-2S ferredoxin-type domain-containing protein n=1 Tax=Alexandrium monilatum TaxID=311494 RepID=A0A7S4WAH3_9DINO
MAAALMPVPACGSAAPAVHHRPLCLTWRTARPVAEAASVLQGWVSPNAASSAQPAPHASGLASWTRTPVHGVGSSGPGRRSTAASSLVGALAPAGILAAAALSRRRSDQRLARSARHALGDGKKKGLPRWAPGGGRGVKETRSPTQIMADMKEEVLEGEGRCYRVTFDEGIGIRADKDINAERTGDDLVKGEVFEVKTEVRRAGRRYFELQDGRGWVFDWVDVNGRRVELVEIAAQLYTIKFPDGVSGILWASDTTMRFCSVQGFATEADSLALTQAGISQGDLLVMIDDDPVTGMPFGQVLERMWAASGRQPGAGLFYRVITQGPYGIGIRAEPDVDGPRTGEDLIRGSVFEVDDILETEGGPTYLHLADGRGWVFDTTPIDPENPSVQSLADVEAGCSLTMWRGSAEELSKTLGLRFKQDGLAGNPFTITVLEEGQPVQRISCPPGGNLRKALLSSGFQVYQELRQVFNCNANQLCGTCVLNVLEGNDNLTVKSVNEKRAMAANPPGFRLCCNIDVYGDVVVQLKPKGVRYGGGTS